jgi:hypothetical protein
MVVVSSGEWRWFGTGTGGVRQVVALCRIEAGVIASEMPGGQ